MTRRQVAVDAAGADEIAAAFTRVREEFDVPSEFPPEVLAEVEALPDGGSVAVSERVDETGVAFVTVDPPGSMDLDQALYLNRTSGGIRVRYAIADVPAFVAPGGAIDREACRRGSTIYMPDGKAPLHPPTLSEHRGSLLPGEVRPAFVWDMTVDEQGQVGAVDLRRSIVRSQARYTYAEVMSLHESASLPPQMELMADLARVRIEAGLARGAASLPMPEQEIDMDGDGYRLSFRPALPAEEWNAQISLLTGQVAASMMLDGGVGILRTLPTPDDDAVAAFRTQAAALGVPWASDLTYGRFLAGLDRTDPTHLAVIHHATSLFRDAAYVAFDGTSPEVTTHAAVAAPYAHVTAPLRRLVDRFGLVVCHALASGTQVPDWARSALGDLPGYMREGDTKANAVDRACTDVVESAALSSYVGSTLSGVIVQDRGDRVVVQIDEPAVVLKVKRGESTVQPSQPVGVTINAVDVVARTVDAHLA